MLEVEVEVVVELDSDFAGAAGVDVDESDELVDLGVVEVAAGESPLSLFALERLSVR